MRQENIPRFSVYSHDNRWLFDIYAQDSDSALEIAKRKTDKAAYVEFFGLYTESMNEGDLE